MQLIFHQLKLKARASFDPMVQDQVRQSSEIIMPVLKGRQGGSSAGRKCDSPRVSACHFVTVQVIQNMAGRWGEAAGLGAETEGRVVYLFIFSPLNRLR